MKKRNYLKRLLAMGLVLVMSLSLAACGSSGDTAESSESTESASATESTEESQDSDSGESEAVEEAAGYSTNYKGNTTYIDIAEQLRSDTTLDLNGLDSEIFTITGYAQGYDFDEAWIGSLTQMVDSGAQVLLMSGSAQFAFNFGGLARTSDETDIRVGGVDSLTQEFSDLLDGGVYDFCSGSYPSMIGPALALVLRALEGNSLTDEEGNAPSVTMSHVIVNSSEEIQEVLTEDTSGNYAYNAAVISALMSADYDTFMDAVSNAQWEQILATKNTYSDGDVVTLSEEYRIGMLRDDVTSDESLAYESYLTELADALGFTIVFSEDTEGNATNEVNQIDTWASAGFDAVISMSAGSYYDQAEACNSHGMVYVQFAAQPEEDDLVDMEALDSYLGAVGPDTYNEAEVGYYMAKYYIEAGYTDFAIFGGSIGYGAEQHAYRVGGMIAAMIEYESGVANTDFN